MIGKFPGGFLGGFLSTGIVSCLLGPKSPPEFRKLFGKPPDSITRQRFPAGMTRFPSEETKSFLAVSSKVSSWRVSDVGSQRVPMSVL